MFNVRTIITQSFSIKSELQITQTRPHLSILNGKSVKIQDPPKIENIDEMCTK